MAGAEFARNADLAPPVDQGSAGPRVAQNDQLGTLIRSENIARLILNLRRDAGPARTWDGSSAVLAVPGLGPAAGSAGFLGIPASARGRTGQQALKRWSDRGHLAGASLQRQPRLDAKLLVIGSFVVPDWDPTAPRRGRSSGVDQNDPVDPLLQPRAYPL
jgi:hypothetical protein